MRFGQIHWGSKKLQDGYISGLITGCFGNGLEDGLLIACSPLAYRQDSTEVHHVNTACIEE